MVLGLKFARNEIAIFLLSCGIIEVLEIVKVVDQDST